MAKGRNAPANQQMRQTDSSSIAVLGFLAIDFKCIPTDNVYHTDDVTISVNTYAQRSSLVKEVRLSELTFTIITVTLTFTIITVTLTVTYKVYEFTKRASGLSSLSLCPDIPLTELKTEQEHRACVLQKARN